MRDSQWKEVLKNYIINNYKEYILVSLLFLIGLFAGVLIVNNCGESQTTEITTYIGDFISKFKQVETINTAELIMSSAKNNLILAIILWIAGTTVIGLPIVLIVILFRGVVLGYTISAITCTLGTIKGIGFCLITILLQNILFIPAILTLGVSSIKLYKSIIKDKAKDGIKIAIIRHTLISLLMLFVLILASVAQNVISINMLKNFIKYF